jgi:large subunit ribosomal protein L22
VSKVLLSAVANARQKAGRASERLDEDELFVKAATVDEGPTLKRFQPAAMGRATPLKKRTSHITILVATKEH